jgi:ABC-type spermidine/putrescine transport system permease subunit I
VSTLEQTAASAASRAGAVGTAMAIRRAAPLAPALFMLVLFFLVPMFELARMSIYEYSRFSVYVPTPTWSNYGQFFSDPYYATMVWTSIKVGFMTTLFTLLTGYPMAYYLTTTEGWERTLLSGACLFPLFVTVLVGTLGWYILLLPFGLTQKILVALGLLHGPLSALNTFSALIVVMVYLHLPYAILIVASSMQGVGLDKVNAARVLGAPPAYILRRILIPLTMPGIASSAILVFALSISSYLVPVLITGQRLRVLPMAIFSYTTDILNWPFASVLAIVLLAIVVAATYVFTMVTNRLTGRGRWEVV